VGFRSSRLVSLGTTTAKRSGTIEEAYNNVVSVRVAAAISSCS